MEDIEDGLNYSQIKWNWNIICFHKKIDYNFVQRHLDVLTGYRGLIHLDDLPQDYILEYLHIWDMYQVFKHPSITVDTIESIMQLMPIMWNSVSFNPNLTKNFIIKYLDKEWIWRGVYNCKSLSWEDLSEITILTNNINYLSRSPKTTWQIVESHSIDWNYKTMSANPNITWDIMVANDRAWNLEYFSHNVNLTWKAIMNNFPWKYVIPREMQIDWEFIYKHKNLEWSWWNLASNHSLTWEWVMAIPELQKKIPIRY